MKLSERQKAVAGRPLWLLLFFLCSLDDPVSAQIPTEADVFVAQAVLAYDDKRYDDALSLLNEALKMDPENVPALYYSGLILLAQNKPALAVEALEKARARAPGDQNIQYQLGVSYFALEQYDKAQPLLESIFKTQPKLENLGYYVGFMRYRQKNYDGAVQAFKTGRASDPTMQQLTKFYSGLALGILGLSERAVTEVEEALKLQPGSPLTGPAERIRDTVVKAREREQRLRAEVRLGGSYDDNVTINPKASTDPLAETLRNRQGRSFGEIAALRLDYSWFRQGPWEATASYSFFQTAYNNDGTSSFNLQDHLGSLGGFYRGTLQEMPYQLGLQYSFDWLTLGGNPFLERHSGTAFATLVENTGNLTTLISRIQIKDFLQDATTTPPQNRDATNWMAGPTHVFRFSDDKHLIRVGYQFDYEDARGNDFEYIGHRLLTGGQYTLPWGETRLRYDYEIHFRDYPNTQAILPTFSPGTMKRHDTEQTHYFRIEKPLHELAYAFPFDPDRKWEPTLSLEYNGDFAQSNLAVFHYHRNVFSLILTWSY